MARDQAIPNQVMDQLKQWAHPGNLTFHPSKAQHLVELLEPLVEPQDEIDDFLAVVRAEVMRARSLFPGDNLTGLALAEEFGETIKALLDESRSNVIKECSQLACMAARLATEGDVSVKEWRHNKGLDPMVEEQHNTNEYKVIHLEDNGQDFLRFIINDDLTILRTEPFQGWQWDGRKLDHILVGAYPLISDKVVPDGWLRLSYKVEAITDANPNV